MKNGTVKIGDTEMYYVSFGSGRKNFVVLPGLSDGLATVKGKALLLSPPYKRFFGEFTVYIFSRKNNMPEGYTIRDMAADQIKAMKNLGIEKASVMGVSQGGVIAQYMAADFPENVEKLVLAVTVPYSNETVKNAVSGWIETAKRGDHRELMADTAEKMYSQAYLEKNRKYFPLIAKLTKPSDYTRFYRNAYALLDFDIRDRLSEISCPALIIAGDDDKTVGNDGAYELKNGISGSEMHIYKGLGHSAFEEAKDFYDRVYEFISR